jgi:hypothetical protein
MASQNQQEVCSICLECYDTTQHKSYMPCFHEFHQGCFNEYIIDKVNMKKDIACPVCRRVHFNYGDTNYMLIMNELCLQLHDENEGNASSYISVYHNNEFESSTSIEGPSHIIFGLSSRTNSILANNTKSDTRITINNACNHNNSMNNAFKLKMDMMWFHYRYHIITCIILIVLSIVVYITVTS